jgi:hypothetical protein
MIFFSLILASILSQIMASSFTCETVLYTESTRRKYKLQIILAVFNTRVFFTIGNHFLKVHLCSRKIIIAKLQLLVTKHLLKLSITHNLRTLITTLSQQKILYVTVETSVSTCKSTRRYNPEDQHWQAKNKCIHSSLDKPMPSREMN